ncbi:MULTISPECIES: DUF4257 domain-containing protein [Bacillus cereus group]|uniref:DUF4257 domain-containing protein n=1 Tax=Bacillus thuringiensis serovar mexicanensis TaxID=180868 RepID=A0A242WA35_BACTU|nr:MULTISPECIES: DUF4257 domain-containing protein [Bacillus cereus group]EEM56301.1 hypothetical protein bthur0007_59210 [Bacillus thuringiensis serovar monterrey BGSC 4AJ1]MEB9673995.1 DUF4257 domain-containing protein [Bacillus anthracis]OTW50826.1 hypothetical protein BK699_09775 [Bacillus thuringiensis serovar mexicanensis]OTX09511.1 hypothetical protein BK705_04820 [Bacillus thuringiensis serovar monterrey]
MLISYFIAGCIGGTMGFLSHLYQNKGVIKKPKNTRQGYNVGFWLNVFMGITAALLAVGLLTGEQSLRNIIVVSIVAGLGGERFLISRGVHLEEKKDETQKKIDKRLEQIEKLFENKHQEKE